MSDVEWLRDYGMLDNGHLQELWIELDRLQAENAALITSLARQTARLAEAVTESATPIQPIVKDENNVLRFKANPIVLHLLDSHPACDMNRLALMNFTNEDRQQFAQLIGYSLNNYSELSYVDDDSYDAARRAEKALATASPPPPLP